jgi:hypothetical protein
MAERIAEVQDKLNQMRQTKLELENIQDPKGGMYIDPQKVLSYVAELRQFLDERGLFERKAFLRSFIEKIRIGDDKITLDYTLPLQPNNSKQETVSVLDIVSSAPPIIQSKETIREQSQKWPLFCFRNVCRPLFPGIDTRTAAFIFLTVVSYIFRWRFSGPYYNCLWLN